MPFKARIYKVGINPCVEVPRSVTEKMKPVKGYIRVTVKINGNAFTQTLVPVKDAPYRLYVNMPMLKGANVTVGDVATFTLTQSHSRKKDYSMHPALLTALKSNKLTSAFNELTPSRQKDILKYLGSLKTQATLLKNINKVIGQLRKIQSNVRIP